MRCDLQRDIHVGHEYIYIYIIYGYGNDDLQDKFQVEMPGVRGCFLLQPRQAEAPSQEVQGALVSGAQSFSVKLSGSEARVAAGQRTWMGGGGRGRGGFWGAGERFASTACKRPA